MSICVLIEKSGSGSKGIFLAHKAIIIRVLTDVYKQTEMSEEILSELLNRTSQEIVTNQINHYHRRITYPTLPTDDEVLVIKSKDSNLIDDFYGLEAPYCIAPIFLEKLVPVWTEKYNLNEAEQKSLSDYVSKGLEVNIYFGDHAITVSKELASFVATTKRNKIKAIN